MDWGSVLRFRMAIAAPSGTPIASFPPVEKLDWLEAHPPNHRGVLDYDDDIPTHSQTQDVHYRI